MSREDFLAKFQDELRGLCVAAFAAEERTRGDSAAKGQFIVEQMVRARRLLERMHEAVQPAAPMPVKAQPQPPRIAS